MKKTRFLQILWKHLLEQSILIEIIAAYDFIIKNLEKIILKAIDGEWGMDYKTNLQEVLQKSDSEEFYTM